MQSAESEGLRCKVCERVFKRAGHLRRHELTHSNERSYSCPQCSRSFARRDGLQRHLIQRHVHDGPSLVQQGNRACISCATAKARCSGDVPCRRCVDRGAACVHPTQDLDTPMQSANDVSADAVAEIASGVPITEIQSSLPPAPDQLPNSSMTPMGDYSYQDWDGFFHETNWLEAPIATDMHWSPLSWDFQPYTNAMNAFEDNPFAHDTAPEGTREVTREVSTRIDTDDSPVESARSGEYYVDGEPARLPRVKRWKPVSATEVPLFNGTFSLHLPHTPIPTKAQGTTQISDNNYHTISDLYNRLCCSDDIFGARFTNHLLPQKSAFEAMISLFREKFEHVLPFLHWTVFTDDDRDYLLDLAVVAVGSQYMGSMPFSVSMHEFTRRCLHIITDDFGARVDNSSAAAALLLNIIGCAYCGDDRLRQHAMQNRSRLTLYFNRLKHEIEESLANSPPTSSVEKWQLWIQRESNTRLVQAMWLTDAMLVAHFTPASTPIFSLESVTLLLPCADHIWRCQDIEEWSNLYVTECRNATLLEILQKLYYTKTFSTTHSEFARILIVHALFHRLWEVERYYSRQLSHWEPSSARQSGDTPFPPTPVWLPSVPSYRSWQNSSCDALDVLHWQANSTIGQNRGIEHPTVLHLHFARIVLLCPVSDIISLARHLTATGRGTINRDGINKATELVRRWALHHQYKARLAAIHAGVTFWHIRRHGVDAFYEPPSLALAALVLWAFSMFSERKSPQPQIRSAMQDSIGSVMSSTNGGREDANSAMAGGRQAEDSETGEVILLDRPTDDELVQQFIRDAGSMTPFMSGVGEVFASRAPPRILDKGIELLRGQRCWGGSGEWIQLLQSLRASRRVESSSR